MSFFKQLLKRFQSTPEAPTSHVKPLIEREGRVEMLPLHNVSFKLLEPSYPSALPIANLSFGGMGLINTGIKNPANLTSIKGVLNIANREIPVELRVAYANHERLGCAFESPTTELKKNIQNYFDLELKALEMKQINDSELRADGTGTPHWHLGENNCELYFIESSGNVVAFRISFFGNSIEYQKGLPLKFGFEISDPEKSGLDVIPGALKFVKNIASVPSAIKTQILFVIEDQA